MSATRPTTTLRVVAATFALAGLCSLGIPTTASATSAADAGRAAAPAGTSGTIAYIKANNVFVARGDGTGARRVTRDGTATQPYHSPSQTSGGIIAVARGTQIVRMTQAGAVLNTIDPPALVNSAGESMDGAVNDVAISPNGMTIAWTFVRYSCPVGADCLTRFATGYTAADHLTRAGNPTYYRAPSWVTNTRTLQTGGYGSQVMLHDVKSGPRHWFDDSDMAFPSTDLADGEVSPDGRWLAQVRGFKETSAIIWYQVSGNVRTGQPPAVPDPFCQTGGESAHASPTWSPDSTALAWTGSTGIWVKRAAADCVGSANPARLAIPGGSQPDWSPAPLG